MSDSVYPTKVTATAGRQSICRRRIGHCGLPSTTSAIVRTVKLTQTRREANQYSEAEPDESKQPFRNRNSGSSLLQISIEPLGFAAPPSPYICRNEYRIRIQDTVANLTCNCICPCQNRSKNQRVTRDSH